MADEPKTAKIRASNEIALHEIVILLYPKGEEPKSIEEWNLRLWLIPGILDRYGLTPKKTGFVRPPTKKFEPLTRKFDPDQLNS